MKWLAWWRGLLEDQHTKLASNAKLGAMIGTIIASLVLVRESLHDRMNPEYFWAYLGILVAGGAASKWLGFKKGQKNVDNSIEPPKG